MRRPVPARVPLFLLFLFVAGFTIVVLALADLQWFHLFLKGGVS
jgi:hypothetical protein